MIIRDRKTKRMWKALCEITTYLKYFRVIFKQNNDNIFSFFTAVILLTENFFYEENRKYF